MKMCEFKLIVILCFLGISFLSLVSAGPSESFLKMFTNQVVTDPCYDEDRARRCLPDFVNAAFNLPVVASSTCGSQGPARFCDNTNLNTVPVCSVCDEANPKRRFSASALTDINNSNNITCWRSEPVPAPTTISAPPDNVTLTLSLGKKYELTYISLVFCPKSVKPDSLAIYKSADFGKSWQPFQFYSSQCRRFYGRPNRATVTKLNEQEALCTDSHRFTGDTTTVQGSRIAFSTLESRPSASDFDLSPILQDWVTATDIRVVFHRLQVPTDPIDEAMLELPEDIKFKDEFGTNIIEPLLTTENTVASTMMQHYAVSDFAVGGRCKCNGHASRCIKNSEGQQECECKHNTAGRDCEKCKLFYFDRPWGRATVKDSSECKGRKISLLN